MCCVFVESFYSHLMLSYTISLTRKVDSSHLSTPNKRTSVKIDVKKEDIWIVKILLNKLNIVFPEKIHKMKNKNLFFLIHCVHSVLCCHFSSHLSFSCHFIHLFSSCTLYCRNKCHLSIQYGQLVCPLGFHQWENSLSVCIMRTNGRELWNLQQFWVVLTIFWMFQIFGPLPVCQQTGEPFSLEVTPVNFFSSVWFGQETPALHRISGIEYKVLHQCRATFYFTRAIWKSLYSAYGTNRCLTISLILSGEIYFILHKRLKFLLTLYLLTWRIWWAPNNASKGQMGFNLVCKGLISIDN